MKSPYVSVFEQQDKNQNEVKVDKNDQKIRGIFQDKLEKHRFHFKEEAWAGMENLLDQAPVAFAKRPFWKRKLFLGVAAAIIALLVIALVVLDNNKIESPSLVESAIEEPAPVIVPMLKKETLSKIVSDYQIADNGTKEIAVKKSKPQQVFLANLETRPSYTISTPLALTEVSSNPSEKLLIPSKKERITLKTKPSEKKEKGVFDKAKRTKARLAIQSPTEVVEDVAFFDTLEHTISKVYKHYAPEKVYLHLDREVFAAGESIWFAAYVKTAAEFLDTEKSDLLHISFINNKDEILKQMTIIKKDGRYEGDIQLPVDIAPGRYTIQAFTNWQQNLNQIFERKINIQSRLKTSSSITENPSTSQRIVKDVDLQFFPEGGTVIEGAASKIAFKALGDDGLSVKVKGMIFDKKGEKIKSFETIHAGMGTVSLEQVEKGMYAQVELPNGLVKKVDLPQPQKKGHSISVLEKNKENLLVQLRSDTASIVNLIVQSRDEIYFKKTIYSNKKGEKITIPTTDLPIGIASLMLFDGNDRPVAERLVFLNESKQLQVDMRAEKTLYYEGDKIAVEVEVKDETGQPVEGVFSVGAARKGKGEQGAILAYYLLESELKGHIERPDFYFDKKEDSVFQKKALDCLLLTQGHRSFNWRKWRGMSLAPINYQGERAIIAGTVKDDFSRPVANAEVRISGYKDKVRTDTEGRYVFSALRLNNEAVHINARHGKLKGHKIVHEFGDRYDIYLKKNLGVNGQIIDEKGKPIADVKLFAKDLPFKVAKTDKTGNYTFKVNDEGVILVAEKKGYVSKEFMIGDKDDFVDVRLKSNKKNKQKSASGETGTAEQTEKTYARQIRKRYKGLMQFIRSRQIKKRKAVVAKPENMLSNVDEDALMLNEQITTYKNLLQVYLEKTKQPDFSEEERRIELGVLGRLERSIENLESKLSENGYIDALGFNNGYYQSRQFYRPKFIRKTKAKDYSNTLYWNPALRTDENGKAKMTFLSSDIVGDFEMVLEGVSSNGLIGRNVLTFENRKAIVLAQKKTEYNPADKTLKVVLAIENKTAEEVKGKWEFELPKGVKRISGYKLKQVLAPHSKLEKTFRFKMNPKEKTLFEIGFNSGQYKDYISLF